MKAAARIIVALTLIFSLPPLAALAQAPCSLSPIFTLFRMVVGSDIVGECKTPATVAENGDIAQTTTRGMVVFRYSDQVTAFTDGQATWLWGPEGLQSRANGDRLSWEVPPSELQPATATGPQIFESQDQRARETPREPTPLPTPNREVSPTLAARCFSVVQQHVNALVPMTPRGAGGDLAAMQDRWLQQCRESAAMHGAAGVDCFGSVLDQVEFALRRGVSPPEGFIAAAYRKCIGTE
jgi:hypothetical protein